MAGIFRKIYSFFLGKDKIDVYGGNKGGFSYLIPYDNTKNEIIGQYIAPPEKTTKIVDVSGEATGLTSIGVKYQSEVSFGKAFAVENTSKTSSITLDQVTPKINEHNKSTNQPEVVPGQTIKLSGDSSFIAGQYVMPVAPKNVESPSFDSHFEELDKGVETGLNMFLEFIVRAFWGNKNNYRSSIFLHDALDKQLKMRAAYHMSGHKDYMLCLNDSAGNVGVAFTQKKAVIADFSILRHEDRGVDSNQVWEDMKSVLAIPIIDSGGVPLGSLSIDSSDDFVTAKFNDKDINYSLQTLCRGMGTLLEAYTA